MNSESPHSLELLVNRPPLRLEYFFVNSVNWGDVTAGNVTALARRSRDNSRLGSRLSDCALQRGLIVGAGPKGRIHAWKMRREGTWGCIPVAFLDDHWRIGSCIAGTKVFRHTADLVDVFERERIDPVLVANQLTRRTKSRGLDNWHVTSRAIDLCAGQVVCDCFELERIESAAGKGTNARYRHQHRGGAVRGPVKTRRPELDITIRWLER